MASKADVHESDDSSSEDEFYDTLPDLSKEAEKANDDITPTGTTTLQTGSVSEDSKGVDGRSDSQNLEASVITTREDRITENGKEQPSQSNEANESTFNTDLVNDQEIIDIKESKTEKVTGHADENEDGCSTCSEEENKGFVNGNKEELNEGLAAEAAECEEVEEEVDGTPKDDEEVDPDGEEILRKLEDTLSQEEKEEKKDEAQVLKKEGNDLYKLEEYTDAIYKYTEAIKLCPLSFKKERSIMFANRAACKIHLKQLNEGVKDCSKALDLHPHYMKVLLRRAQTYEQLEKLDEALTDYQKSLEMDQGCHIARAACMRLPGEIQERNEKLKTEMMGKLKDLGNMVLRPFGLSTDNFNVQQDASTGSYSMNFVQNSNTNGK